MVSNTQGNDSPTADNESVNINELVSRVKELEQKVDNQQETIDNQQSTIESQQETIDEQQNEIDELRSELTEHQERSGRKIAETLKDVNQLQESLESGSDPTPTDGGTTIQEHNLKPIEQISRADNDNLDEVIDSPSVRRAVSLFKNIMDWGSRTPKGIVLKSSDNPLSLLSADMDESLCWKQYYRACETLESLSEGAVTFVSDSRHGKMLILHERSEVYDRMLNGTLSMSSVGVEG